ncbi:GMP reductase, partial [Enterococcus faecalis]
YEVVQLIANKCIVNSRSECDSTVTLGKHSFKMPVVPANMQTIIDETIAETLAENGYFYNMHRFDDEARVPFIKKMQQKGLITS